MPKRKSKRDLLKQNSENQKKNQYINKAERERIAREQEAAEREAQLPPKVAVETIDISAKGLQHSAAILTLGNGSEEETRKSLASFYRSTLPEGAEFDQDACDRFVEENMAMTVDEESGVAVNTYVVDDRLVFVSKGDVRLYEEGKPAGIDKRLFMPAARKSVRAYEAEHSGSLGRCYANTKYTQPEKAREEAANEPVADEKKAEEPVAAAIPQENREEPAAEGNKVEEPVAEQQPQEEENPAPEENKEEAQSAPENGDAEKYSDYSLQIGGETITAKVVALDPSATPESREDVLNDFYFTVHSGSDINVDELNAFVDAGAHTLTKVEGLGIGVGAAKIGDTYALVFDGDFTKEGIDAERLGEVVRERMETLVGYERPAEKTEIPAPVYHFSLNDTVGEDALNANIFVLDPNMSNAETRNALTDFYYSLTPKDQTVSQDTIDRFILDCANLTPVDGVGVGAQMIGDTYAVVMTGDVYKDASKTELDTQKIYDTVHQRLEVLHALNLEAEKAKAAEDADRKKAEELQNQQNLQNQQADQAQEQQKLQEDIQKAGEKLAGNPFPDGLDFDFEGRQYHTSLCAIKGQTPEERRKEIEGFYRKAHEDGAVDEKKLGSFMDSAEALTVKDGEKTAVIAIRDGDKIHVIVKGDFYRRENGEIVGYDTELLQKLAGESIQKLHERERAQEKALPVNHKIPMPGGKFEKADFFVLNENDPEAQKEALREFYRKELPKGREATEAELDKFVSDAMNVRIDESTGAGVKGLLVGDKKVMILSGDVYKRENDKVAYDYHKLTPAIRKEAESLTRELDEREAHSVRTVHVQVGNKLIPSKVFYDDPARTPAEREAALRDFYKSLAPADKPVSEEEMSRFALDAMTLPKIPGIDAGIGMQQIGNNYACVVTGSVLKADGKTLDVDKLMPTMRERMQTIRDLANDAAVNAQRISVKTPSNEYVPAKVFAIDPNLSFADRRQALMDYYFSNLPEGQTVSEADVGKFVYEATHLAEIDGVNAGVGLQKIGDHYAYVVSGNVFKEDGKTVDVDKLMPSMQDRMQELRARERDEALNVQKVTVESAPREKQTAKVFAISPSMTTAEKVSALSEFYRANLPAGQSAPEEVVSRFALDAMNLENVNGVGIGLQNVGGNYAYVVSGDVFKKDGKTVDFDKLMPEMTSRMQTLRELERDEALNVQYASVRGDGNERRTVKIFAVDPNKSTAENERALAEFYRSNRPEGQAALRGAVDRFVLDAMDLVPVDGLNGGVGLQKIGGRYACVVSGDVFKEDGRTVDLDKLMPTIESRMQTMIELEKNVEIDLEKEFSEDKLDEMLENREAPDMKIEKDDVFIFNPKEKEIDLDTSISDNDLDTLLGGFMWESRRNKILDKGRHKAPEVVEEEAPVEQNDQNDQNGQNGQGDQNAEVEQNAPIEQNPQVEQPQNEVQPEPVPEPEPEIPDNRQTVTVSVGNKEIEAHIFAIDPNLSLADRRQALADYYCWNLPKDQADVSQDVVQQFLYDATHLTNVDAVNAGVGLQKIGDNYAYVVSGDVFKEDGKTIDVDKLMPAMQDRMQTLLGIADYEKDFSEDKLDEMLEKREGTEPDLEFLDGDVIIEEPKQPEPEKVEEKEDPKEPEPEKVEEKKEPVEEPVKEPVDDRLFYEDGSDYPTLNVPVDDKIIQAKVFVVDPTLTTRREKEKELTLLYKSMLPKDHDLTVEELEKFHKDAKKLNEFKDIKASVGAFRIGDGYAVVLDGDVCKPDGETLDVDKVLPAISTEMLKLPDFKLEFAPEKENEPALSSEESFVKGLDEEAADYRNSPEQKQLWDDLFKRIEEDEHEFEIPEKEPDDPKKVKKVEIEVIDEGKESEKQSEL